MHHKDNMQLPNKDQDKEFDRIDTDPTGQPLYGRRMVDGHEEIVHIPTKRSNMQYWQPDVVLDASKCVHRFLVTSVGKREIECIKCGLSTTFNVGVTFTEENGNKYFWLHGAWHPVD
jgi:hypothetical protein